MSVNRFTYSNDSNPYLDIFNLYCFIYKPGYLVFTAYTITNLLLLLPLCIFILCHGLRRWRHQSSSCTAATASHSDVFTYHLSTIQLMNVFGSVLGCCGVYNDDFQLLTLWFYLFCFNWCGEMFFHLLTSVEHYIAVIYPITYLSLKKERGIRIRNLSIACIWLICAVATILTTTENIYLVMDLCFMVIAIIIISFLCLSVLCVLIRPGPGEQSRDRERVDQSKKRAFYTILAILGVLWLRVVWNVVGCVQGLTRGFIDVCVLSMCVIWINLLSSLVLPLLFLQRAGTLATCMSNIKRLKD